MICPGENRPSQVPEKACRGSGIVLPGLKLNFAFLWCFETSALMCCSADIGSVLLASACQDLEPLGCYTHVTPLRKYKFNNSLGVSGNPYPVSPDENLSHRGTPSPFFPLYLLPPELRPDGGTAFVHRWKASSSQTELERTFMALEMTDL